ncbi:hypothetical protein C8F01DRAFT_640188 [Mycena amicta]|nr:hypothetical protein C8F01DRAFT_640188 [Mycena amicta]
MATPDGPALWHCGRSALLPVTLCDDSCRGCLGVHLHELSVFVQLLRGLVGTMVCNGTRRRNLVFRELWTIRASCCLYEAFRPLPVYHHILSRQHFVSGSLPSDAHRSHVSRLHEVPLFDDISPSRRLSIGALALLRVLHTSSDALCGLGFSAKHFNVSPRNVICGGLTTASSSSAWSDHTASSARPSTNPTNPPLYEQSLLTLHNDHPPHIEIHPDHHALLHLVPVNGFLPYGGRRVRAPPSSDSSTRPPSSTQTQARRHISIAQQFALMVIPTSRLQGVPMTRSHPLLRDSHE